MIIKVKSNANWVRVACLVEVFIISSALPLVSLVDSDINSSLRLLCVYDDTWLSCKFYAFNQGQIVTNISMGRGANLGENSTILLNVCCIFVN